MTRRTFKYTKQEIEGEVKGNKNGGARVSVPSDWIGKEVRVVLIKKQEKDE